jgi:energy-coupling factor transport system substrate-specific component
MPVVVLAALAILGRLLFTPIPNFQPATALIILAGLYFGRNSGLLCGIVVAFVSNFFVGQGLWTPWQMLAWGLVGYCAGVLFDDEKIFPIFIYLYGFTASLLFGIIMDAQFFISFVWDTGILGLATALATGLPMNLLHAVSTVIFLAATLIPWGKKLSRLKTKYGIRAL